MQKERMPDAPKHRSQKCCGKCAFRKGSQELQDGYGWAHMVSGWADGDPFYCHESVPGHHQEEQDDRPRWRTCGGWEAHRKTGFRNVMRPLGVNPEAETVYDES